MSQFDAVALVLDVGITSGSSGFLSVGIRAACQLLQRKLFSESPDRFGLVLVGTQKSDNPLKYDRVTLVDRGLYVADWNLLELVQSHVKGTFRSVFGVLTS